MSICLYQRVQHKQTGISQFVTFCNVLTSYENWMLVLSQHPVKGNLYPIVSVKDGRRQPRGATFRVEVERRTSLCVLVWLAQSCGHGARADCYGQDNRTKQIVGWGAPALPHCPPGCCRHCLRCPLPHKEASSIDDGGSNPIIIPSWRFYLSSSLSFSSGRRVISLFDSASLICWM